MQYAPMHKYFKTFHHFVPTQTIQYLHEFEEFQNMRYAHAICFGFSELSINMVSHEKRILGQSLFLKKRGALQLPIVASP